MPLQITFSQDIKFGKVSIEELQEKFYPLDSSAHAAILFKQRKTFYDYNGEQGWKLVTKVHERIKIYNKEGYDWATKIIKLYTRGGKDESVTIKAYTFNLTNNKIEKIKLKNSEIFDENINKYWNSKKFTMPNLKVGSVIEWEYAIYSPFYSNIDDMIFQYKIPLKYVDSEVRIPEYFKFKYQPNIYNPINLVKSKKNRTINYSYRSQDNSTSIKTTLHSEKVDLFEWVYSTVNQNIPAIIDEPFTNNINNYISKSSFELSAVAYPNSLIKHYNTTWEDVTKTIYKSTNFRSQLDKTSYFKEDLASSINMNAPINEKVAQIFQFVKSKIKWNGYNNTYTTDGVKKAYNEGVGNVAEINLTLVAMLKEAKV